jgi:hypothetical protein
MSKTPGRNIALSPFRRLVTDLMHFSSKVPSVTVERRMNLARLLRARAICVPRPSWSAIFAKAYGLVAAERPELRRSYMTFPWPHLYEHPGNVVTFNIERHYGDERLVIYVHIRCPERRTLSQLDTLLRHYKEEPLENLDTFRRANILGRLPFPLRRLVWWVSLNVLARQRVHNYGTFGITSVAAQGAGIVRIIPLLTSTLHYGLFDDAGSLDMRLSFDHRVLDGAAAAEALTQMEQALQTTILDELLSLRIAAAA